MAPAIGMMSQYGHACDDEGACAAKLARGVGVVNDGDGSTTIGSGLGVIKA